MIDIKELNYKPSIDEMIQYINNPSFNELLQIMDNKFQAKCTIEYSKDSWLKGWNIKFRKSGKSLCVVYPKPDSFTTLVVEGNKEREKFQALLPSLSESIQKIYHETNEGMGQRWLMIPLDSKGELFQDILKLIEIRRMSK